MVRTILSAFSYANQGSRNSAILPFTSALSAFCAAATAAIVGLLFIDTVSAMYGSIGEDKKSFKIKQKFQFND